MGMRKIWREVSPTQEFVEVVPLPKSEEIGDSLRFICISDTHGMHRSISLPDGDILLHSGDFTTTGKPHEIEDFFLWLTELPHRYKIVIAGNHDITMQPEFYHDNWKRFHHKKFDSENIKRIFTNSSHSDVIYLEDSSFELEPNLIIYGSPWQPWFCDWAFNLERGEPCREKWRLIPNNCDILITHGPPLGRGDKCSNGDFAGCEDLLYEIQQRIRPKVHLFGHIHEGYGYTSDGTTLYINPSACTINYIPVQPPIVFDLPRNKSMSPIIRAPMLDWNEEQVQCWLTENNLEDLNDIFIRNGIIGEKLISLQARDFIDLEIPYNKRKPLLEKILQLRSRCY